MDNIPEANDVPLVGRNDHYAYVFCRWLGLDTSGMSIMELGLPSGFEVDTDSMSKVKTLKRVETPNKKVVLYFDEVGNVNKVTYYFTHSIKDLI